MMKWIRLSILTALPVLAISIFAAVGLIYHKGRASGPTPDASAVARPGEAALHLSFKVLQPRLLYQQDTYCAVTLKNTGVRPLEVSVPPLDNTMPIVHVLNVRTGAKGVHQRLLAPRGVRHEPGRLSPGEGAKSGFRLLDIVPPLEPGDYDVRVAWVYDRGGGQAESETVRVQVLPTTPKRLVLADAYGGHGSVKFGVWVNPVEAPNGSASIVRNRFTLKRGGGVSHVLPVSPCPSTCRPAVSAPAVGTVLGSHWVAWIDGKTLYYTHVDDELGVAPVQSGALLEEGLEIVAPLYSAEVVDTRVRPLGALLLCQPVTGNRRFRLHAMELSTGQSKPLGVATLEGPKPLWITSHARTGGERLVSYVQAASGEVLLYLAAWPGPWSALTGPTRLAGWKGEFVAGGATMDREDTILGGTLVFEKDNKGKGRLQLVAWSVSSKNTFHELRRQDVGWPTNERVGEARMGVSDEGQTAALISDDGGNWYVYDGAGHLVPVPAEVRRTTLALEMGFLNGFGEPLLIAGKGSRGFKIMRLDGSPLPPRQTGK